MKSYHVAHILVAQKYEAEDLLRKMSEAQNKNNQDQIFQDLAKKYSTCPSRQKGGDLGILTWGKADPDFEEAVRDLKIGDMSKPIRTRFGYHLIKRMG